MSIQLMSEVCPPRSLKLGEDLKRGRAQTLRGEGPSYKFPNGNLRVMHLLLDSSSWLSNPFCPTGRQNLGRGEAKKGSTGQRAE